MRLAFALLLGFVPLVSAQTGGTVEGTVVDGATQRGIPGVTVDVTPAKSKGVAASAVTDAAGAFRIEGLAAGDYTASFSKSGYTGNVGVTRSTIRIADGGTARISPVLTQYGSLGGRVTDRDGRPFSRVMVQLTTASRQSHMVLTMSDNAGEDGRFRFPNVPPGQYILKAQPIESSILVSSPKKAPEKEKSYPAPPVAEGERRMWVNTFYPGVIDRSQAARIVIHPGWNADGYDIRVIAAPVFRVHGIVLGEDGKPAPGITVGISVADRWERDSNGTKSADDGTFEFGAVHQGDWRLLGMRRGEHSEPELMGFADALVTRHDVENVVIQLSAPFSVAGKAEAAEAREAGGKLPVDSVSLESVTRAWSATGHTNRDGTFRIDGVYPDRYEIRAYGVDHAYYVESIWLGDREVTDQEVAMGAGSAAVRVVYRAGAGSVRGAVENGGGATVVLLPRDERLLTYQYVRSAKCDREGRYGFDGLRPGDYSLMAFPHADLNTLEDPEVVRPLAAGAVVVRVENGRVASADLRLSPLVE
jgi:protocatechuate 3,4-dioxygenase beta subunit